MAEKPEDLNLPASAVTRIIKDAIPDGVNISKDAKTAINRAASVFILYATASANSYATKAKRKTILPNDLFQALTDLELEEFVPELKASLEIYKKDQKDKKQAAANRKQMKASANEDKSSGPSTTNPTAPDMDTTPGAVTNDEEDTPMDTAECNELVPPPIVGGETNNDLATSSTSVAHIQSADINS